MYKKLLSLINILCLLYIYNCQEATTNVETRTIKDVLATLLPPDLVEEQPTVLVALLVRNKAHVLPLFFTYFEQLNYPKDRIALWIRSDHNEDNSIELIQLWLNNTQEYYHNVNADFELTPTTYENETSSFDWPYERFRRLIDLKESALEYGQKIWADYIFYLDADVLLTSSDTLRHLVSLRLPVVAPMLLSESLYSNFWCGMTPDYYYLRTDEYKEIYNANKEGTFQVRMIHSALLIHLKHMAARYLTFDRQRLITQQQQGLEWVTESTNYQCRMYDGPMDDIIVFAISANCSQIPLFINNELAYGYILQPLDQGDSLEVDKQLLINIRSNIVHDLGAVARVPDYWLPHTYYPTKENLTLDRIYMINLERRTERREKMERLFQELGLNVEYFAAIDGKTLNATVVEEMNIKMLPGYEDPYHQRQMTMGEIGCFLSHYRIWERMVEQELQEVLILEDDIRFEPNFRQRAVNVLNQARNVVEYDLVYFGRKRLKDESEPLVMNATNLVHVGYSYWTLGYVITLRGAKKLLAAKPLEKLLPVDEFLPIMFNRHPNKTWSEAFETRDLLAFSAAPLLLFPTHYTGDEGYISDTEDSELTTDKLYNGDAQLKSDRPLDFPRNEPIELKPELDVPEQLKLPTDNFADINVAKTNDEL